MLGTYSLNFIFTVYRVGWAGLSAEVREGKGRSEGGRKGKLEAFSNKSMDPTPTHEMKMEIFFNNLLICSDIFTIFLTNKNVMTCFLSLAT